MREIKTIGTTYREIGGSVTLTYPGGTEHRTLWLMDDSLVVWVQVSPYRFCNLYYGGKMGFEYVIDRGVENTRWSNIVMPAEYIMDDDAIGRMRVISVASLVAARILA